MGIVSSYVDAPFQGVSQASPQVRLQSQATEIINGGLDIPDGVRKRPPLNYLGKLLSSGARSDAVLKYITDQDGQNFFLLVNREGSTTKVRLYDADTLSEQAITVSSAAQAYLDASVTNPHQDIGSLSIQDYTFLLNRNKVVAQDSATNPSRPYEAFVWVKTGDYSRIYSITVDPASGTTRTTTYKPGSGASANDSKGIGTDRIAEGLYNQTIPAGSSAAVTGDNLATTLTAQGFTVTLFGSIICFSHPTIDFTISVEDDLANTSMVAVKEVTKNFSDLPAHLPINGFTVKIEQQSQGNTDDYYVEYQGDSSTGIWKECLAPGAPLGLDPDTMPVALVNNAGWTLDVQPWRQRTVGDADLCPDPSFVGDVIKDIGYWKGRIALISPEECHLTALDSPFKIYPTTLTTDIDSDPINRTSPSDSRADFRYGITFEDALVCFGSRAQGLLTSGEKPATEAETVMQPLGTIRSKDITLPPIGSNGRVYYSVKRGTWASIYELDTDRVSGKNTGDDMCAAIPRYIPSTIDRAAVVESSFTTLYGESGSDALYPHVYRYNGQERVQNAFSTWLLPPGWVLGGLTSTASTFYLLLINTDEEAHLVSMDYAPLALDFGGTILTRLDLRISDEDLVAITYNSVSDTTTLDLPYDVSENTVVSSRGTGSTTYPEGTLADHVSSSGKQLVIEGDWTDTPFWVGELYEHEIAMSRFYALGPDGKPLHTGRFGLRKMDVELDETGEMECHVTIGRREAYTYVLSQNDVDEGISLRSTFWSVPLGGDNTETSVVFRNDSHLPSKILGLEWFAEHNPKARRIS